MKLRKIVQYMCMLAATIAYLALVGCGSTTEQKTISSSQPAAITRLTDSFVESNFIAASQQGSLNEKVVLIDTRSAAEYAAGHIEGAINVQHGDYIKTRTENGVDIKYLILNDQEFIDFVNRLGITPDTTVVTYDNDISFGWAPRLAWTLQYYGHARAFSLNGGIQKWQLVDGHPVVTTPTLPNPNTVSYVVTGKRKILATKQDVSAKIGDASTIILDARVPGEYAGVTNATWDTYRLGHIPGAVFIDWEDVLKDNPEGIKLADGSRPVKVLKSEQELLNYFAAKGITADSTIIAHCEGGIRSSFITQVLLGLGYKVTNYDGSWNEWGK
jgi:thiosulfate/3-mercaptopyruvate sulfurtransferase